MPHRNVYKLEELILAAVVLMLTDLGTTIPILVCSGLLHDAKPGMLLLEPQWSENVSVKCAEVTWIAELVK